MLQGIGRWVNARAELYGVTSFFSGSLYCAAQWIINQSAPKAYLASAVGTILAESGSISSDFIRELDQRGKTIPSLEVRDFFYGALIGLVAIAAVDGAVHTVKHAGKLIFAELDKLRSKDSMHMESAAGNPLKP